jgi:hypothetical protein
MDLLPHVSNGTLSFKRSQRSFSTMASVLRWKMVLPFLTFGQNTFEKPEV